MIRLSQVSPGRYTGPGDGIESGPFEAAIEVSALPGGAISIDYVAVSPADGELHREHTVCCQGFDGRDMLFIAHTESPFVTTMVETSAGSGRFVQPEPAGPYTLSIVAQTPDDGRIRYAWWWGATGEEPVERSCADVRIGASA